MTSRTWALALALGAWAAGGCKASSGSTHGDPGHDATLSALSVTSDAWVETLSPAFAPDVHVYGASVHGAAQVVAVTATATDPRVKSIQIVQAGAAPVAAASGVATPVAMPGGSAPTSVRVLVTAEDGVTITGYTLRLSRAALGTDATLASLTDSAGALHYTGTTGYTYTLTPAQVAGYTLTPTLTDPFASMTVDGTPAVSGSPVAIDLTSGAATVRIAVTSEDGNVHTTYTVQITVPAAGTNATLASLTDSAGVLAYTGATSYTYQVQDTAATGYTVTPTLTDPFASMTIDGTAATSGAPAVVDLRSGAATVTIVVTSASGTVHTTYTLRITTFHVAIPVTGISVTGPSTVVSPVGGTLQLAATVTPSDAPQEVTWSTSDASVATVSSSGLVTSHKLGEVTITASATDASGVTGSLPLVISDRTLIFLAQPGAAGAPTVSASLNGGALAVSNVYGASGNAFKYVAGVGFYGTNSNGFVALPFPLGGDFSMTASVVATASRKANNACGLGLGVTTGFLATAQYAYVFMPATPTTSAGVATKYVNSATNVTTNTAALGATTFNIGAGASPVTLTMSRVGGTYTLGAGGVTTTVAASAMTDGTTAYGGGPVYPTLSFNNLDATVTNLVIRNGAGDVIFDSSTDTIRQYVPASLTLSSATATAVVGQTPTTVTATAVQPGGGTAGVSAVAADPTVVNVQVTNGANSSTITLTALRVGSTTVTVTNTSDPNAGTNTRTIAVTAEAFNATDGYPAIAGRLYPTPSASAAYVDGELSISFDAPPTLAAGGSIDLYDLGSGALVDRIFFANETQPVMNYAVTPAAPVPVRVRGQLARVSGNAVYFTPHFGALQYSHAYYVGISTTAITGTLGGVAFTGFSNAAGNPTWRFTTRAAPTLGTTVRVDGSQATTTADFRTVGGALMYLAANPPGGTAITIDVAAGTYIELVNYRALPNPALTITLRGPAGNHRGDTAVIQYTNGGNLNSQNARASFYFAGANLVLENLTLQNTGLRSDVAQAETLYFDSRAGYTLAVGNCSLRSYQDTVQTSGRAWFYDSYLEGNTDFIWGTSDVALFQNCDLRVINDAAGTTYSIFVARTGTTGAATVGKGYVLMSSRVSVDGGITAAYGRNAGSTGYYDQVALVNDTFSGSGALAAGLWVVSTPPLSLGDSTYVGWKAAGNTGLGADTATTATGTAQSIADLSTEYDTRDHVLNRVITVSGGTPTGYAAAATPWDTSALAAAWGAPIP